jgi:hypothetical protein
MFRQGRINWGTEKQLLHRAGVFIVKQLDKKIKKGKAVHVTGQGDPWGCETSRLPHFLDNRLTDGGEVVSLTRRPSFTPQEDSWYSILLEDESNPGQ